jgi:hypothetical protein
VEPAERLGVVDVGRTAPARWFSVITGPATVIIEPSVFTFSSNDCGTWMLVP